MSTAWSVAVAAVFVWLGMVLAISFLEAPLKFRAPGSDAVLAGADGLASGSRSRAHYAYVGLEAIKVLALLVTGMLVLTQ